MTDKILKRPTSIHCATCDIVVPVGARGPIPKECAEHRGRPKAEQLAPHVKLPRGELDRIRRGYEDAIELEKAAKDALRVERERHAVTQRNLSAERLKRAEVTEELFAARGEIVRLECLLVAWWRDPLCNPPAGVAALDERYRTAEAEDVASSAVEREADTE